MAKAKIAITMDGDLLSSLDGFVKDHVFANRSQAITEALREKIQRLEKTRLERECLKLNASEEQTLAETGIEADGKEWPAY